MNNYVLTSISPALLKQPDENINILFRLKKKYNNLDANSLKSQLLNGKTSVSISSDIEAVVAGPLDNLVGEFIKSKYGNYYFAFNGVSLKIRLFEDHEVFSAECDDDAELYMRVRE